MLSFEEPDLSLILTYESERASLSTGTHGPTIASSSELKDSKRDHKNKRKKIDTFVHDNRIGHFCE